MSPRRRTAPRPDFVGRRRLAAALVLVVGLFAVGLYAFGRQSLFAGGQTFHVALRDTSQLRNGSPVRVAGLDIGRVTGIASAADGKALVTVRIKEDAPALRAQDRWTVRPRLPFEGNFYLDVSTGDPSAPPLRAGDTVPARLTASSVQLDEVLTTLEAPVRRRATGFVANLASGLGTAGLATDAALPTGSEGFRDASRALDRTLTSVTRAARALRGRRPGDLAAALRDSGALTQQLAGDPQQLAEIVTNYRRVIGRFAASDDALRRTVSGADRFLAGAPASLRALDAVLPDLRRFAVDLRPVLRELPRQTPSINRALAQVGTTALPSQLPRLVRLLEQPVADLPVLERQLQFVAPYAGPIARCLSKVVVPGLSQRVPDGPLSLDQPAWLELLHAFSGLAAASPAFDANGTTIRAGLTEGDTSLAGVVPGLKDVINVVGGGNIEGVSPKWLGHGQRPSRRVDQPCEDQKIPDLSQLTEGKPFEGLRRVPSDSRSAPTTDEIQRQLGGLRDALRTRLAPGSGTTTPRSASRAARAATRGGGERQRAEERIRPSVDAFQRALAGAFGKERAR